MLSYFTSCPFKHYCNSLTECLWAMVYVPFKLQLLFSSRDECVCEHVCMCPTERTPIMFCFCQNGCRDGIRSVYHELGKLRHCLTMQTNAPQSQERTKTRRTGRKASALRDALGRKALTVLCGNSYVAKGHEIKKRRRKNQMLPGKGCFFNTVIQESNLKCPGCHVCIWILSLVDFALSILFLIMTHQPLSKKKKKKLITCSFFLGWWNRLESYFC